MKQVLKQEAKFFLASSLALHFLEQLGWHLPKPGCLGSLWWFAWFLPERPPAPSVGVRSLALLASAPTALLAQTSDCQALL